jgi:hypothetical protein
MKLFFLIIFTIIVKVVDCNNSDNNNSDKQMLNCFEKQLFSKTINSISISQYGCCQKNESSISYKYTISNSSHRKIDDCAGLCSLGMPEEVNLKFMLYENECYCLFSFYDYNIKRDNNCSNQNKLDVFELNLTCSLSTQNCQKIPGCDVIDDCCLKFSDDDPDIGWYKNNLKLILIIIIGLGFLECFIYIFYRNRRRQVTIQNDNNDNIAPLIIIYAETEEKINEFISEKTTEVSTDINSDQDDDCVICCDKLKKEQAGKFLCGHIMHITCIKKYLKSKIESRENITCPICRQIFL